MIIAALVLAQATRDIPLESLDITKMIQGWGTPHAGKSVDNHPIRIGGVEYKGGVGTHAASEFRVRLNGAAQFRADVGVDDETKPRGSVEFQVWLDGKRAWSSGEMKSGMAAKHVVVSTAGHKEMILVAEDG